MTDRQRAVVASLIGSSPISEWHHGDCTGSDDQAAHLAKAAGAAVVAHPPNRRGKYRANSTANDVILPEKHYHERNRDIVDATEEMIAAPNALRGDPEPEKYSGTYYTIRYARARGKPLYVVYRDGSVWEEFPGEPPIERHIPQAGHQGRTAADP